MTSMSSDKKGHCCSNNEVAHSGPEFSKAFKNLEKAIHWQALKTIEKQWKNIEKAFETIEKQWRSMKTIEMIENLENHWKSKEILWKNKV